MILKTSKNKINQVYWIEFFIETKTPSKIYLENISEIIRMKPITTIPNTPPYIEDKDEIITVLNLKKIMGQNDSNHHVAV